MNKTILVIIALIVTVAQLAAPLSMVFTQEDVLTHGKAFKFKTRPVDPTDPFRGAYLSLRFKESQFEIDSALYYVRGEKIFVSLRDSAGFAIVTGVSKTKPAGGDYLSAYVDWLESNYRKSSAVKTLYIQYPFDEYYIEESKAKDAEEEYDRANRDENQLAYAIIKIKDGNSAIQDLIINGKSATDIMKEFNKGK